MNCRRGSTVVAPHPLNATPALTARDTNHDNDIRPTSSRLYVESDLREELTRAYDICHGCRLCFKFCTSFPTLFEFVDAHDGQDAARLTAAQQDQVVDGNSPSASSATSTVRTSGSKRMEPGLSTTDDPRQRCSSEPVNDPSKPTRPIRRCPPTDLSGGVGSRWPRWPTSSLASRTRRLASSWKNRGDLGTADPSAVSKDPVLYVVRSTAAELGSSGSVHRAPGHRLCDVPGRIPGHPGGQGFGSCL